ncbi:MAG: DUF3601 domain-containing protein [Chloroflexi bacterium]|nr:DUF3601 domain-containing protein [Chloroflexota bacterium]
MKQTHQKPPFVILVLLVLIGTGAFALAFWLVDHRQAMPNSDVVLVVSIGIFLVSSIAALIVFLRWRDGRRTISVKPTPSTMPYRPDLEGTVYGMASGSQYQVIKSFVDFYGNTFEQGEVLRFKERHFVPYHGGHTIVFDERSLYLQEDESKEILENFSGYIVKIVQ